MEACSEYEWSRIKISELIELYRRREVLWNPTVPAFKDKRLKNYAWGEIAAQMQVDKFEVQNKVKNLITCFRREAKKEKVGAGASQSVKWWAFESLLFLQDKTTLRTITEAGISENEDNVTKDLPEIEVRSAPVTIKRARPTASPDTMNPPTKRWYSPVSEESFSVGKNVQYKDEYDIFGELVACQLRKCTDLRERAIAKQRINQVLFDLEMSSWNNPSSSHSTSPSTSRCSDAFA